MQIIFKEQNREQREKRFVYTSIVLHHLLKLHKQTYPYWHVSFASEIKYLET